jgi:hypothetical protein
MGSSTAFGFGGEDKKDTAAAGGAGGGAGGFGFGGAADSTSKPADSSAGGFGGGGAGGGFGFGGDAAADKTSTPAAGGGGGFGFGGETPKASGGFGFGGEENKSKGATESGGFGFGGDNASSNTTTSSSTAGANEAQKAADGLAAHETLRLDNKTLEKIIETWEEDLKEHRSEFTRQRTDLDKWDKKLGDVEEKTNQLVVKVNRIELAQDELAQNLDSILSQQKELDQMLSSLEREVKTLYERDQQAATPADEERHLGYFLAEKVDAQLGKMETKLGSLVEKLNKQHDQGTEDNPISLIVQTLNAHLNALQWIDLNAQAVQSKISLTQKEFAKRQMSLERRSNK